MTAATGLYNVVRQVFASIGIAVAATQITSGTHRYHDRLAEHVTMYAEATRLGLQRITAGMVQAGADSYTAAQRALAILNLRVTRQAAVLAYNHVFELTAALFALAIPLTFLLAGRRQAAGASPGDG
jgi:DHA2 family multidrug resistance protein